MLRLLVVALLLANLMFWAWSTGTLEFIGWVPTRERDPARLAEQVRPDAVRILAPAAATAALSTATAASQAAPAAVSGASAAAAGTPLCLEAGPFVGSAIDAAEQALLAAALPEGSLIRANRDIPAVYAVILGPFASREALQKKREEIARLRLPFEALDLLGAGGKDQPGFALGRYDNRTAAESALATFSQRGINTARVAMLRPASSETRLRVEFATQAQADQLRALSGGALGAGFAPCAPLAPAAVPVGAAR